MVRRRADADHGSRQKSPVIVLSLYKGAIIRLPYQSPIVFPAIKSSVYNLFRPKLRNLRFFLDRYAKCGYSGFKNNEGDNNEGDFKDKF